MQAIILAEGGGTRLRPFTARWPKAFAPIADKSVLAHQVALLRRWGIDRITVLTCGYSIAALGEEASRQGLAVEFVEVKRRNWKDTWTTAFRVTEADVTIILNCDVLLDESWKVLLERHLSIDAALTLAASSNGAKASCSSDQLGKRRWIRWDGRILSHHSPSQEADTRALYEIGVSVVAKRASRYVPGLPMQHEDPWADELVPHLISQGERVQAVETNAYWRDVGTWPSLHEAHFDVLRHGLGIEQGGLASLESGSDVHVSHSAAVHPTARVFGRCYIGPQCSVGHGAVIEDSVLSAAVSVGAGASLRNALVLPRSALGQGITAMDCTIGPDWQAPRQV